MEKKNDPSTGSGTNKNQKIEELSDDQLKEVAGGVLIIGGDACDPIGCSKMEKGCNCTECREGWVLKKRGNQGMCLGPIQ